MQLKKARKDAQEADTQYQKEKKRLNDIIADLNEQIKQLTENSGDQLKSLQEKLRKM